MLVDKREQRPYSQSGSTNHGVKTSTSPCSIVGYREDGSARKPACLVHSRCTAISCFDFESTTLVKSTPAYARSRCLAHSQANTVSSTSPRGLPPLGLPIVLAGRASKPVHPHIKIILPHPNPLLKGEGIKLVKKISQCAVNTV